jgi:hypothetical protein
MEAANRLSLCESARQIFNYRPESAPVAVSAEYHDRALKLDTQDIGAILNAYVSEITEHSSSMIRALELMEYRVSSLNGGDIITEDPVLKPDSGESNLNNFLYAHRKIIMMVGGRLGTLASMFGLLESEQQPASPDGRLGSIKWAVDVAYTNATTLLNDFATAGVLPPHSVDIMIHSIQSAPSEFTTVYETLIRLLDFYMILDDVFGTCIKHLPLGE